MAWAIYLTGIPGSGKSTVAEAFLDLIEKKKGILPFHLRLDKFRKLIVPEPRYDEQERDLVYRALAVIASFLVESHRNVVIDATAYKKEYRDMARQLIPDFYEVYLKCRLETAMKRESKRGQHLVASNLYRKALSGKKEVGQMVGVDVIYQITEQPELVIDTEKHDPLEAARLIFSMLYPEDKEKVKETAVAGSPSSKEPKKKSKKKNPKKVRIKGVSIKSKKRRSKKTKSASS